jgi:hypothetical protein
MAPPAMKISVTGTGSLYELDVTPDPTNGRTPSVRTAGGQAFRPTVALNLTPLQLSLAGDAKALTVPGSTTAFT